jgi:tetrahydromethanopterin S-methyltransferase subunit H
MDIEVGSVRAEDIDVSRAIVKVAVANGLVPTIEDEVIDAMTQEELNELIVLAYGGGNSIVQL